MSLDSLIQPAVYVGIGLILLVVFIVLFKKTWRIARPNQALIISGRKRKTAADEPDSLSFRIVTGSGTLVQPLIEQAEILDLSLNQVTPTVNCPTKQGIEVGVKGVVIFKIGDDNRSIANAARRFLGKQGEMASQIEEVFAGQLRSIVGGMTVEEMIQDRLRLTDETRNACTSEAEALGLVIDSLQIQEILDPSEYIKNIAAPNLAGVKERARIAEAEANERATAVEQRTEIAMAQARRDTTVQTAAIQAEVEARQAEAAQQGPLARTKAEQQVLEQEALSAQRRAAVKEQELNASVRLVADANAYATRVNAEASRLAAVENAQAEAEADRLKGAARAESVRAAGQAEADVIRAKGQAEGESLKAKAEGVAANQDAVLSQMLVEQMPEAIRAAASMYNGIDKLTVLNGTEGMSQGAMSLMAVGTEMLGLMRGGLLGGNTPPAGATSDVPASSNGHSSPVATS
jgi:uncharacterized membrane protein YqiK